MIDNFLFIGLPYTAFIIMIIGTIIRYRQRGFQVSSLSSQFLEGRKLFYGSQAFHIGIVFLFVGHLVAFLFPRSVIAWNSQPVRLIILEVSAFAFGLSVLFGLLLLIYRRLTNKRLQMVTSKMDVVVYIVLLTQVITGLLIAYYNRWGSTWFSVVLTPYIRSIFTFTPDIKVISQMPLLLKIHMVSAFTIIGLIPFTRLMHFLVFPWDYIYRSYQVFIWNWSRKKRRNSEDIFPPIKATND